MKENIHTFKNTPQDISKCIEKKLEDLHFRGHVMMCDINFPNSNFWLKKY